MAITLTEGIILRAPVPIDSRFTVDDRTTISRFNLYHGLTVFDRNDGLFYVYTGTTFPPASNDAGDWTHYEYTDQDAVNAIEAGAINLATGSQLNGIAIQTLLDGKVDDSQVLTNVPANALFTDTQLNQAQVRGFIDTAFINTLDVDAETVSGHTVATSVPSNAVFTDTQLTETQVRGFIPASYINSLTIDADTVGGHTVATNVPSGAVFTDTQLTQAQVRGFIDASYINGLTIDADTVGGHTVETNVPSGAVFTDTQLTSTNIIGVINGANNTINAARIDSSIARDSEVPLHGFSISGTPSTSNSVLKWTGANALSWSPDLDTQHAAFSSIVVGSQGTLQATLTQSGLTLAPGNNIDLSLSGTTRTITIDSEVPSLPTTTGDYVLNRSASGGYTWDDAGDEVTLAGTPDYITISGQTITRHQIDLANDVTGTLPIGNGGTGLTSVGTEGQAMLVNASGALEYGDVVVDLTSTRTATSVAVSDGSGNPATISGATSSAAGVMVATDKAKLDGIEANADVTDTANVVAALTAGTGVTIEANGTISATASGLPAGIPASLFAYSAIVVGGRIVTTTTAITVPADYTNDYILYSLDNSTTPTRIRLFRTDGTGEEIRTFDNATGMIGSQADAIIKTY